MRVIEREEGNVVEWRWDGMGDCVYQKYRTY